VLGDGSFGTVFKAINSKTSEVVAIKKMKQKYRSWEECLQLREIKSLRRLTHPNIVRLKEVLLVAEELHLVFDYLSTNIYEEYSARKREGSGFSEKEVR
jgi:serine/threonine protein kinase